MCRYVSDYHASDYEEDNFINEFLTPKEVMELLAIGRSTFYRLVNSGEIPAIRIGKKMIRVKREDLFKL